MQYLGTRRLTAHSTSYDLLALADLQVLNIGLG